MSTGHSREDSQMWQIVGLHHVAFAHASGDVTAQALEELLGLVVSHEEKGPGFMERMIPVAGDCYVQLLEATDDGVVDRFVSRKGAALHHLALEVTDVDAAVADLKAKGANLVDEEPRLGGMETRIAFLHPSNFGGLLVELIQRI